MSIKLSSELIRVHAHLCGDGGLYQYETSEKDRINRAQIVYFNNNTKLINSFRKDMNKLFGVKMTLIKMNRVQVQSIRIAKYLLKLSEYGSRKWRIPRIIKNSPRKFKIEWTKAFIHDEGYFPFDRNCIRIKCMNLLGLQDIKEMLDSVGIGSNLTGPNCDSSYYINIKKEAELKNFVKEKNRNIKK